MNHLHQRVWAQAGSILQLSIDRQANVFIADDVNYSNYRGGRRFRYYGGLQRTRLVRLGVPHTGHWNVVVDIGGATRNVRVSKVVIL